MCDNDAGLCEAHEERCDGSDHDCDGRVDEARFCPDDTLGVAVEPAEGGVWALVGGELVRVWPSPGEPIDLSGNSTGTAAFAPDGTVWFGSGTAEGGGPTLFRRSPDGATTQVDTPPCDILVTEIAVDDTGAPYYACNRALWRAGSPITAAAYELIGVLGDGSLIAALGEWAERDSVLFDPTGREVSRFHLRDWFGHAEPAFAAATQNDQAWVLWTREIPDGSGAFPRAEFVVVRVAGDGRWNLVRRVRPSDARRVMFALPSPDGSVFAVTYDAFTAESTVVRYPSDSITPEPLWSTAAGLTVRLLYGP